MSLLVTLYNFYSNFASTSSASPNFQFIFAPRGGLLLFAIVSLNHIFGHYVVVLIQGLCSFGVRRGKPISFSSPLSCE